MPHFNVTPNDRLTDPQGRPYFAWDADLSLETFKSRLADPEREIRAYFTAKLLRQAKPDDVFTFVSRDAIRERWVAVERQLGRSRRFWEWLLAEWDRIEREASPERSPAEADVGAFVHFDPSSQSLANALCALLARVDARDLRDACAFEAAGATLRSALVEAPKSDPAFSPLTLAWVLNETDVASRARAAGYSESETGELKAYGCDLVRRLLVATVPPAS